MQLLSLIRARLSLKLFLSYLIVVLVGVFVLSSTAEVVIPQAYARHLAAMRAVLGNTAPNLAQNLEVNFRAAVSEALGLGALSAFLAAVLVSVFVSRQVVAPVQAMMVASQRIAEGHYEERVKVVGDVARGELDELAQLALSFNRMASRLEQTEAMRRQLIGDVSHELRTPLTAIKGSMEGLIDGVLPPNAETFEEIHREADRLQRLVNDLQELSRVEAGAYELVIKPIEVSRLIRTTVTRLGRQFEEKGVTLTTGDFSDLPRVLADEDRIGQVLLNLVGNALQYTPKGRSVSIQAQQKEDEIMISVHDTGIGIPSEHLPHLFSRFYRIDKSRSRAGGGSGIGLTIAKHIVEAHGGHIWAESSGPGEGSVFTFTLPVAG